MKLVVNHRLRALPWPYRPATCVAGGRFGDERMRLMILAEGPALLSRLSNAQAVARDTPRTEACLAVVSLPAASAPGFDDHRISNPSVARARHGKPRSRERLARTASALNTTALSSGAKTPASVVLPAPGRPIMRIFRFIHRRHGSPLNHPVPKSSTTNAPTLCKCDRLPFSFPAKARAGDIDAGRFGMIRHGTVAYIAGRFSATPITWQGYPKDMGLCSLCRLRLRP